MRTTRKNKTRITYNNGKGWLLAEEKNQILYIKRAAYVRAWQKQHTGYAIVTFDTTKEVRDDYDGRVYQEAKEVRK